MLWINEILTLHLIVLFLSQVGWHQCSTIFVAYFALNSHGFIFASEGFTWPTLKIDISYVLSNNSIAVLMNPNITFFTIKDLVGFFIVIISADEAPVIVVIFSKYFVFVLEVLRNICKLSFDDLVGFVLFQDGTAGPT
jgi:hypothetical protein